MSNFVLTKEQLSTYEFNPSLRETKNAADIERRIVRVGRIIIDTIRAANITYDTGGQALPPSPDSIDQLNTEMRYKIVDTALIFLRRFFTRRSLNEVGLQLNDLGKACILAAYKAEGIAPTSIHIVRRYTYRQSRQFIPHVENESDRIAQMIEHCDKMYSLEGEVFRTLEFELENSHAYDLVVEIIEKKLKNSIAGTVTYPEHPVYKMRHHVGYIYHNCLLSPMALLHDGLDLAFFCFIFVADRFRLNSIEIGNATVNDMLNHNSSSNPWYSKRISKEQYYVFLDEYNYYKSKPEYQFDSVGEGKSTAHPAPHPASTIPARKDSKDGITPLLKTESSTEIKLKTPSTSTNQAPPATVHNRPPPTTKAPPPPTRGPPKPPSGRPPPPPPRKAPPPPPRTANADITNKPPPSTTVTDLPALTTTNANGGSLTNNNQGVNVTINMIIVNSESKATEMTESAKSMKRSFISSSCSNESDNSLEEPASKKCKMN